VSAAAGGSAVAAATAVAAAAGLSLQVTRGVPRIKNALLAGWLRSRTGRA
jgi:hypothetical protein